jgi:HEAT repeat protein
MSKFVSTVVVLSQELNSPERDQEKLGVLARSLRWHEPLDREDMLALMGLGELVRRKWEPGGWEVERAVLEILCERAETDHIRFLIEAFRHRARGKHSNDRRRLALHALSRVAARTGDQEALLVLEEGLAHSKKDTRGWAIGFLLDSYGHLDRPVPESAVSRLRFLAENDISADVRVEAVMALARLELADEATVQAVVASAQEQADREGSG